MNHRVNYSTWHPAGASGQKIHRRFFTAKVELLLIIFIVIFIFIITSTFISIFIKKSLGHAFILFIAMAIQLYVLANILSIILSDYGIFNDYKSYIYFPTITMIICIIIEYIVISGQTFVLSFLQLRSI